MAKMGRSAAELFGLARQPVPPADMVTQGALFESGDELVRRILDAIRLRRPVLVTGPRGSGKTFCAREAIRLAKQQQLIGGHHFVQGNREIPRDYLTEDNLTIRSDPNGKPEPFVIDALLVRLPDEKPEDMRALRAKRKEDKFPDAEYFPALVADEESPSPRWEPKYWTVLFLDEINRFSDGVLDSLLSLTEERLIVRGGLKLHVPIIVVATANPPGYDTTAKKLSPPLQARIARSYRVSQPTLETLSLTILPDQVEGYFELYGERIEVPLETMKLVSAAALCLWGDPDSSRKGIGFLTPATRALLERVIKADAPIKSAMVRLGELTSFGPDARSVGDWVGSGLGRAIDRHRYSVSADAPRPVLRSSDLVGAAIEALASKVRENFNEGAEPLKAAEKESLVVEVVTRVLRQPAVRKVILMDVEGAAEHLIGMPVYFGTGRKHLSAIAQITTWFFEPRSFVKVWLRLREVAISLAVDIGREADEELVLALRQAPSKRGGNAGGGWLVREDRLLTTLAAKLQEAEVQLLDGAGETPKARQEKRALVSSMLGPAKERVTAWRADLRARKVRLRDVLRRLPRDFAAVAPWAGAMRRLASGNESELTETARRFALGLVIVSETLRDYVAQPERVAPRLPSPMLVDLLEQHWPRKRVTENDARVRTAIRERSAELLGRPEGDSLTDEERTRLGALFEMAAKVFAREVVAAAKPDVELVFAEVRQLFGA